MGTAKGALGWAMALAVAKGANTCGSAVGIAIEDAALKHCAAMKNWADASGEL